MRYATLIVLLLLVGCQSAGEETPAQDMPVEVQSPAPPAGSNRLRMMGRTRQLVEYTCSAYARYVDSAYHRRTGETRMLPGSPAPAYDMSQCDSY